MWALRAFVLGTLAIGVLAYALAAALAVAALAGRRTLDLAFGPLAIVSVTTERSATVTTFGPGLIVLALAGGVVNLVAAWLLARRRSAGHDLDPGLEFGASSTPRASSRVDRVD